MKRVVSVVVLLSVAVLAFWHFAIARTVSLKVIPDQALIVHPPEETDSFLEEQVALLAESYPDYSEETDVSDNRSHTDGSPTADAGLLEPFSGGIMVLDSTSVPKLEKTLNADDTLLRKAASGFAYVEFKGVIGGRPLASFCVDPKTGKCKVVGEGDIFQEVRVEKIQPDSVQLTYQSAQPITKPLVSLDIDYKPMSELTPEEKEMRKKRYQELYGNRFKEASLEYRKRNGGKVFDPPDPSDQRVAADVYQQTYGNFFRHLQEGTLDTNNRDYPEDAPTLEESVAEYFETYWPDQVEWEVSDEEKSGGQ